jgi:transposase
MRKDIDQQQIIKDYQNGTTTSEIIKKYKVSLTFIYKTLTKYNIQRKSKISGLTTETLDHDLIINLYGRGLSASKIAKQLGCSHTLILDFLDKNGVAKTPKNQLIRKYKKIKEDYFDTIDTQGKAYYLGLLFADGCVSISDNSSRIEINLQEEDKEILEKFSLTILRENALKFRDLSKRGKKNQWVLRLNNKKMCKQLEKIGCPPAKSLILFWPQWLINPELQRHFIRGYYDGDGGLKCNEENYHAYTFQITSTIDFCQNTDKIINSQLPIHFTYDTSNENGITTTIYVSGNRQILTLLDWLYRDATIYMERKYQKYLELKAWIDDVDNRKNASGHHINQYA